METTIVPVIHEDGHFPLTCTNLNLFVDVTRPALEHAEVLQFWQQLYHPVVVDWNRFFVIERSQVLSKWSFQPGLALGQIVTLRNGVQIRAALNSPQVDYHVEGES